MSHFTLLQFTNLIKKTLEQSLDPTYWIVAEISELRIHPKGHCYLELVEKENEQIKARMKATIWSYTYQNLHHWFQRIAGSELKVGMKVLVNAEIQFHESFGLSLNIKDIDANYTIGERQRLKQQVILRLQEEGLINRNKEKELPLVPQNIAIISSPNSAGYEDFFQQINDSPYKFITTFFQADMQGQASTKSIVEALKLIFEKLDRFELVVILRGGGAQTDLDCFNTYLIGKAIARFPLPVITGIGHERDDTIADIVAKTKLKTPTAVAEFLIDGVRLFEKGIMDSYERIVGLVQYELTKEEHALSRLLSDLHNSGKGRVSAEKSDLKLMATKAFTTFEQNRMQHLTFIRKLGSEVKGACKLSLERNLNQIERLDNFCQISDPDYTLQRGFSYSTLEGKPINENNKPGKGKVIFTKTRDYIIESTIDKVN